MKKMLYSKQLKKLAQLSSSPPEIGLYINIESLKKYLILLLI